VREDHRKQRETQTSLGDWHLALVVQSRNDALSSFWSAIYEITTARSPIMAFSNAAGETLTLPSPTHAHHVDVPATVRALRRSLSRSPSSFNLLRTKSDSSECSSAAPQSPTPASNSGRGPEPQPLEDLSGNAARNQFSPQLSHLTTPLRPNIKLSVRSARTKTNSSKTNQRSRISPKSPLRRAVGALPESRDTRSHFSIPDSNHDQENSDCAASHLTSILDSGISSDRPSRHSMHFDTSEGSRLLSPKLFEGRNETPHSVVSPLKRSDALMDLGQSNSASPKAKRRSLHGLSSLAGDVSILDQVSAPNSSFDIHEDGTDQSASSSDAARPVSESHTSSASAAVPRRPSSLRKKTLQQRTADRRPNDQTFAQALDSIASPAPRARARLSLDQYLPPGPRESPFQSPGNLPNPSAHPFERPIHQPHPLSRSLTQSSSSSSVMDDSPSHIPLPVIERPKPPINFSRSLPPGASRPSQGFSEAVATPRYKSAVPNQAAFMSTGLVSKKNWQLQLDAAGISRAPAVMPDTPCKKQVYSSNTYPPQSGSGRRRSRPSFGSPSSPFNPLLGGSFGTFGNAEKGNSLFKLPRSKHSRTASVFSVDGEDPTELLTLFDNEIPPTPTKHVMGKPPKAVTGMHSSPLMQQNELTIPAALQDNVAVPACSGCRYIPKKSFQHDALSVSKQFAISLGISVRTVTGASDG
jgi:mitosis inhibitor protein kinase SWE1